MVTLSVLDQSPIRKGGGAAEAIANTIELARAAERFGYRRYWLAEHHNTSSFAQLGAGSADRRGGGRDLAHTRRFGRRDAAALQPAQGGGVLSRP